MLWGLVTLMVVAGCNSILGLEEPERTSSIVDTDEDGVVDQRDNCPSVVNELQEDRDGDRSGDACDQCPLTAPTRDRDADGIDDACDSCVLGPQVDDDGDGAMDACDLCPATATTSQLDTDGDLVGDECDGSSADDRRALFDPFRTLDPVWEGASAWALGADGSSIAPLVAGVATLRDPRFTPQAVSVQFEIANDGIVGVGFELNACELRCVAGTCMLHLGSGPEELVSSSVTVQRATMQLASVPRGILSNALRCELRAGAAVIQLLASPMFLRTPTTLFATSGSRILGVDFVE